MILVGVTVKINMDSDEENVAFDINLDMEIDGAGKHLYILLFLIHNINFMFYIMSVTNWLHVAFFSALLLLISVLFFALYLF